MFFSFIISSSYCCLLPIAYCLLPFLLLLLPIAYCLLYFFFFLLPTAFCLLPNKYRRRSRILFKFTECFNNPNFRFAGYQKATVNQ